MNKKLCMFWNIGVFSQNKQGQCCVPSKLLDVFIFHNDFYCHVSTNINVCLSLVFFYHISGLRTHIQPDTSSAA